MMIKDPWHSRPFDVHVWSEHKQVMELTEAIFLSLSEADQTLIKGRSNNRGKTDLYKHLRHVIVDQYVSYKLDPTLCTGIARGFKHWQVGSRYNGCNLSHRILDVIDVLVASEWLYYTGGKNHRDGSGRNRTARIKPSAKLEESFSKLSVNLEKVSFHKDQEVIILRDDSKHIDYDDTPKIKKMRKEVQAYNSMMLGHSVKVASLNEPYITREIKDARGRVTKQTFWLTPDQMFTRRTFTRGSFKLNGRWNGGWWQNVPKILREDIIIDGEETIEYDYSALHPSILAYRSGNTFTADPYTIEKQILPDQRTVLKALLLRAINAKTIDKAVRSFQTEHEGYKKKDLLLLLDTYIDKYPFMADHLGSDQGIKLMHTDSQIATQIINYFVANGKPILPIHDSFIVKLLDYELLLSQMANAIEEVVGEWIPITFG